MESQKSLVACFVFLFLASFATPSTASLIRFDWEDNQGDSGYFVWDPGLGIETAAIVEFSYIFYDGTPTPPGYLPNAFIAFNNDLSWDLNTGTEGVGFTFDQAFTPPFSMDPSVYDAAFENGNMITANDFRIWNDVQVTAVPESSGFLQCLLVFGFLSIVRRYGKRHLAVSSHRRER